MVLLRSSAAGVTAMAISTTPARTGTTGLVRPVGVPSRGATTSTAISASCTATTTSATTVVLFVAYRTYRFILSESELSGLENFQNGDWVWLV